MIKKINITIPELTGDEIRKLHIYLPNNYYQTQKRYPVLYMFDGHNLFVDEDATFGKSWGMKKYLDSIRANIIVVGIECNHSPDHGRLKEYSPFEFEKDGEVLQGLGETTMNWIVNTLKPMIDKKFRTLPRRKHTYIAGSSMGGLMSLYAILQYNKVFSKAIALSPSLWTNPKKMNKLIGNADLHSDTTIYVDYGSKEFENHAGMREIFQEAIDRLMSRSVFLTSRIVPHGVHTEENWEKQLPFIMNIVMY